MYHQHGPRHGRRHEQAGCRVASVLRRELGVEITGVDHVSEYQCVLGSRERVPRDGRACGLPSRLYPSGYCPRLPTRSRLRRLWPKEFGQRDRYNLWIDTRGRLMWHCPGEDQQRLWTIAVSKAERAGLRNQEIYKWPRVRYGDIVVYAADNAALTAIIHHDDDDKLARHIMQWSE